MPTALPWMNMAAIPQSAMTPMVGPSPWAGIADPTTVPSLYGALPAQPGAQDQSPLAPSVAPSPAAQLPLGAPTGSAPLSSNPVVNLWNAMGRGASSVGDLIGGHLKDEAGVYGKALASLNPAADLRQMAQYGIPGQITSPAGYAAMSGSDSQGQGTPDPSSDLPSKPIDPAPASVSGFDPSMLLTGASGTDAPSSPGQAVTGGSGSALPSGGSPKAYVGGQGASGGSATGSGPDYMGAYRDALSAITSKTGELTKKQQAQVDLLRQGLSNVLGTPLQYDLTPLAALVDSWTGSHLQSGYARPESAQERRQEIARDQQGIAQADQGITQTQLQNLQSQAQAAHNLGAFGYQQQEDAKKIGLEQEKIGVERAKAGLENQMLMMRYFNRPMEDMSVRQIGNIDGALNNIQRVQGTIQAKSGLMGPVKGLLAYNPYDDDRRNLGTDLNSIRESVESLIKDGTIRSSDVPRVRSLYPNERDPPTQALHKVQNLFDTLGSIREGQLGAFRAAGYNTSGFEQHQMGPLSQNDAPHGQSVVQNGITYSWNGSKYVPQGAN